MKFDIGDTVLLIHSGEEGIIVEQMDKEMVKVNVNGVVFPVYLDQIEYPYFRKFQKGHQKNKAQSLISGEYLPIEKKKELKRAEKGMSLSFLPEYDTSVPDVLVKDLKTYLINETHWGYHFNYQLFLNQRLELEVKNELSPFSNFYLQDILFESLSDHPKLVFNFSLKEPDNKKAAEYHIIFRPKAKQIIQKLQELEKKANATFGYLLFEKYPDKESEADQNWSFPDSHEKIRYFKQRPAYPDYHEYEVDLHIEKLTHDYVNLTPTDMLAIQLGEFNRKLNKAIASRQFSLVVIHGIGKGTLRNEIHEILRVTPEVKSFVNQYDIRYGYGATEIFFEYK